MTRIDQTLNWSEERRREQDHNITLVLVSFAYETCNSLSLSRRLFVNCQAGELNWKIFSSKCCHFEQTTVRQPPHRCQSQENNFPELIQLETRNDE